MHCQRKMQKEKKKTERRIATRRRKQQTGGFQKREGLQLADEKGRQEAS